MSNNYSPWRSFSSDGAGMPSISTSPSSGSAALLVGYIIYKSTFLPRILGVLEVVAGVGYATYLWPPLANYLYPYNLALGVGELALGFWLLVFGVNVERWKEQAALGQ